MCRYDVKYGSAGFDSYGYQAGCAFATGSFEEVTEDPLAARYLCSEENLAVHLATSGQVFGKQCTYNHASEGYCIYDPLHDNFLPATTVHAPPVLKAFLHPCQA